MKKHLKVALAVVLAMMMVILPIGTLATANEQVLHEQQLVQAVQTAFSDTPNYSNYDIGPVSNYQYSIQDYDIESTAYDSSILETEPCAIDEPMYAASSKIYDEGVITRAQWLHNLTSVFHLSLQQQNLPDFYFSDEIDSTYEFYNDILLAVGYGIVDIEAGYELNPDGPLTREFAAQTLAFHIGTNYEEPPEYTYSDVENVTYRDEVQWSLDNALFELIEGEFCPEREVSGAELEVLIAYSENEYNSNQLGDTVCEYEFAEGVIEIPNGTDVSISNEDDNYTITIKGYENEIPVGSTIAVYVNHFAFPFVVSSVENGEGVITVYSSERDEDAITSANTVGSFDVDMENFEANTEPQRFVTKDGREMVVETKGVTFSGNKVTIDLKITIADGISGTIKCTISNLRCDHRLYTGNPFTLNDDNSFFTVSGNINFTGNAKFDYIGMLGDNAAKSLTLGSFSITGTGIDKLKLSLDLSASGNISVSYSTAFKIGASFRNGQFNTIKEFSNGHPSVSAELEGSIMLKLEAKLDVILFGASASMSIGPKVSWRVQRFNDGQLPNECETQSAYLSLFANVEAHIGSGSLKKTWGKNFTIFGETNSPIRSYYHYEDGVQVFSCSRESSGAGGHDNHFYATSPNSNWYSSGQTSVGGSGYDAGGNPIVLWTYTIKNDNTIKITGYNGSATVLTVPSEIDGYQVSEVGANAFKNNTRLAVVTLPNCITTIGSSAFSGCTSLSSIVFPESLTTIDGYAFSTCTALTSVELPEGLIYLGVRAFENCSNLSNVFIPASLCDAIWAYEHSRIVQISRVFIFPHHYATLMDLRGMNLGGQLAMIIADRL